MKKSVCSWHRVFPRDLLTISPPLSYNRRDNYEYMVCGQVTLLSGRRKVINPLSTLYATAPPISYWKVRAHNRLFLDSHVYAARLNSPMKILYTFSSLELKSRKDITKMDENKLKSVLFVFKRSRAGGNDFENNYGYGIWVTVGFSNGSWELFYPT